MQTLAGNAPLVLITLLVVISLYKFLKIVWNNFFASNEFLGSKFPRHGLGHSIKPVRISNIRPLGVLRGQSASEALSSRVESFKVPEQTGAFFHLGVQRGRSAFEEVPSSRAASDMEEKVIKINREWRDGDAETVKVCEPQADGSYDLDASVTYRYEYLSGNDAKGLRASS